MAERTGVQEIDQLIEAFQQEPLAGYSPWTGEPTRMKIAALRIPTLAEGRCNIVATQFAEFLRDREIEAESLSEEGYLGPADDLGYRDRPVQGRHDQHDLTFVDHAGFEFTVDFTAAQYGYSEFPLVQRRPAGAGDDAWERVW